MLTKDVKLDIAYGHMILLLVSSYNRNMRTYILYIECLQKEVDA